MIKGKFQWLMFIAVLLMPLIIRIKDDSFFYFTFVCFAVLMFLLNYFVSNSDKND